MIVSEGLLLGTALAVQFPLLHIIHLISARVFTLGIVSSGVLIYVLTMLCALYPGWVATKVDPAQELHFE